MNASTPQILRSAHGSPSRVRGPENHGHWVICGLIICPRIPGKAARPVSGGCPVCRTAVA